MLDKYSQLLFSHDAVAEERGPYLTIRERHIQAVWLEQKYLRPLCMDDGQVIEILSPGVWNTEAGPDFQHAHVRIGERELWGDIEIHLAQENWNQHKHHLDPNYDRVFLHVVLWNPRNLIPVTLHSGDTAPTIALQDFLSVPIKRLLRLIDLDLYPYKRFARPGNCARPVFGKLTIEESSELFVGAALWRLQEKALSLRNWVEQPALWAGAGIAMALGYKNNAQNFLDLFLSLTKLRLQRPEEYLALSMGACGLFKEPYNERWKLSAHYCTLQLLWQELHTTALPTISALSGRQRPLNHPVRRLAYLSKLLVHPSLKQIGSICVQTWRAQFSTLDSPKGRQRLRHTLHALIPSFTDAYWNNHYLFEEKKSEKTLPLLGLTTKDQILVNTFLPLIYADIHSRQSLSEQQCFVKFYQSLPAPISRKQRYLEQRFLSQTQEPLSLRKAVLEQGAFQVHRDFCMHYEASCSGCPFEKRLFSQNMGEDYGAFPLGAPVDAPC